MTSQPIAILNTGLVTSVGLSAPATCAAIRAKISNPTETRFIGSDGEWIMAHQVQLEKPWRGRTKLAKMAAMAIAECLAGMEPREWERVPLLLCVAEQERPGRMDGLDDLLLDEIQGELGAPFHGMSSTHACGRVGLAVALAMARRLLTEAGMPRVIVAGTDSMIAWRTLNSLDDAGRLLTDANSDGFLPGEAASAVLLGHPTNESGLRCIGVGFGLEAARIDAEIPLKGEGLACAIRSSLEDAGLQESQLAFRICDLSGEQFYFKDASLGFSRLDRTRRECFDMWHPAECVGEVGAAIGPLLLAVVDAACRKGYSRGSHALAHLSADEGSRASLVLSCHARETPRVE